MTALHARPRDRGPARPRPRTGAVVAGVLGELLITLGVVLLLFLVWQLWWTTVVAQRDAAAVVDAFRQTVPAAATDVLRTDDPPVAGPVGHGETIGVLSVPRWDGLTNNAMPVVEGTTPALLDRGLTGRYEGTQQLGEVGNVALAGHRRTYGDSFRHVDLLEPGDRLLVETAAVTYVYEVTGDEVVLPHVSEVLLPVPHAPRVEPTERLLTLTTCHSPTLGAFGNSHRWITYSRLVGWIDRTGTLPPPAADAEVV